MTYKYFLICSQQIVEDSLRRGNRTYGHRMSVSSLQDDVTLLFNKFFELKIDPDSLICENTDIELSVNKPLLDSNNISAFTTKYSKRKNVLELITI